MAARDTPRHPPIPHAPLELSAELENMLAPGNAFPVGTNDMPLIENFAQRLKYRTGTYFQGLPKPIDTFYDKVFYGKVDRYQNVIVPKKDSSLLKQTSYDKNIFVFDFVADAFFKLKRNLKIAGDAGGIERDNTVLYNLSAERGWYDYESSYKAIVNKFIVAHDKYLKKLEQRKFNKIITCHHYINSLINYLKTGEYKLPVTLTKYVLSSATPARLSGLVIETAVHSYSSDLKKYTDYFLDPNFSYYVRAARKFGFYVDKNGPWRLFADVFSPPMAGPDGTIQDSGQVTGAIQQNFFNTYYDRTYTLDLPLLKKTIHTAFNNFAVTNELIIETVAGLSYRGAGTGGVGSVACGPASTNIIGTRTPVDFTVINDLGDGFWLPFYFNVRTNESRVQYSDAVNRIEEAIKISDIYGYDEALIYINNLFKPYLYDERIFKSPLTQTPGSVIVGAVTGPTTGGGSGGY